MARKSRRVSKSGRVKIQRAISCGWRPGCGGPLSFLRLRALRRKGGAL
jgi:hypothetical protein